MASMELGVNLMLNDIKKIYNLVKKILKDYPETRESDKMLMLKVWEKGGLKLTEEQKFLFVKLPAAESITRARRELRHLYKPRDYQQHLLEQEKIREHFRK